MYNVHTTIKTNFAPCNISSANSHATSREKDSLFSHKQGETENTVIIFISKLSIDHTGADTFHCSSFFALSTVSFFLKGNKNDVLGRDFDSPSKPIFMPRSSPWAVMTTCLPVSLHSPFCHHQIHHYFSTANTGWNNYLSFLLLSYCAAKHFELYFIVLNERRLSNVSLC